MTINGAIMELVMLCEHPMMPNFFKPSIQKVIETISEAELVEPTDTADTPQTDRPKCRNERYYKSCEYEDNCNPTVCFKALDEFQDAVTDCDHKCIQTEVGCERTDCLWK